MAMECTGPRMKILVVDDNAIARAVPSRLLRSFGYEVYEAADGEMGWAVLLEKDISLVVSDWVMPNLAGIDLCRRIRAHKFEHMPTSSWHV